MQNPGYATVGCMKTFTADLLKNLNANETTAPISYQFIKVFICSYCKKNCQCHSCVYIIYLYFLTTLT